MKNWKIYFYLLFTYIVMHVGSVFLCNSLISILSWNETLHEKDIEYRAAAWSLFITNAFAAIVFFSLIVRNKKFFHIFKGKKSSIGNAVLWGFIGFFLHLVDKCLPLPLKYIFGIKPGSENTALLAEIAKVSPIIIISIVLFAPILEEIIFRRILFGGIYQKRIY